LNNVVITSCHAAHAWWFCGLGQQIAGRPEVQGFALPSHNLLVAKNTRFLATMLLGHHPPQLGSYWHVSYCGFDTA